MNYLNDREFAREWARARAESRGLGRGRIEEELRAKGIDPELISEVMREVFAQADEHSRARSLLEKRFKTLDTADPGIVRRAAAFLKRRGYSDSVISDLLSRGIEGC